MRKYLLFVAACAVLGAGEARSQDLSSFVSAPASALMEFHNYNADMFPLPKNKHFSARINMWPPFSIIFNGVGMKAKLISEGKFNPNVPQVDIVGTFGTILALSAFNDPDIKPSYNDYTLGINVAKSVDEKTRLYWGIYNASVNYSIKVTSSASNSASLDISGRTDDTYIGTGIEYHTRPDKFIYVQTAYGLNTNTIVNRIGMWYGFWEIGLNIFPEASVPAIIPGILGGPFSLFVACHLSF